MPRPAPAVEKALRRLQSAVRRRPGEGEIAVATRNLPPELTEGEQTSVSIMADEMRATEEAVLALLADLRFEHLGGGPPVRGMLELDGKAEAVVEYFANRCRTDRKTDHVPAFVKKYAQEPFDDICYVPVEFLTVAAETEEVAGVRFLPVDDPRVLQAIERDQLPPREEWFSLSKPVGCVAAMNVRGTNQGRMAMRARWAIEHALRVLRVGLATVPGFENDFQLRFRRGGGLLSSGGYASWKGRGDAFIDLTLASDLSPVLQQPVAGMHDEPVAEIDKKADLALRWMERACLEFDLLPGILFRFFALEALLGDRQEGLKAYGLAFRQAQLAYISTGEVRQATDIWLLYDQVRSVAVHGGDVANLGWREAEAVRRMIGETLNQYLALTRAHGLKKRSQLRSFLEEHPSRLEVISLLRAHSEEVWAPYFDKVV